MHVYGIFRQSSDNKTTLHKLCSCLLLGGNFIRTDTPGDCDGIHRFQVDARITALSRPSKVIYDVKVAVTYIQETNYFPILCEIGQTSR